MDAVTKIPIVTIIFLFLSYIIAHYFIGVYLKKLKKADKADKNLELVSVLFKWFPAIYLIFLMLFFYLR